MQQTCIEEEEIRNYFELAEQQYMCSLTPVKLLL